MQGLWCRRPRERRARVSRAIWTMAGGPQRMAKVARTPRCHGARRKMNRSDCHQHVSRVCFGRLRGATQYACIHACTHAYIHTCMHVCMHIYIHACMHTCMHAYIHACMHTYIQAHTYICTHTYILAYMHTSMHTYMPRCTHTRSLTHTYTRIYLAQRMRHVVRFWSW